MHKPTKNRPPASLTRFVLIVLCLGMTIGCAKTRISTLPITDGYHHKLPLPATKTIVWGSNKGAVQHLTTWLMKSGLTVVDRTKLLQYAKDHEVRLNQSRTVESDVLRMGKGIGAQLVIFISTKISSGENLVFQSGLPTKQAIHTGAVFIRAVDVGTGEINWSGTARYVNDFSNFDDGIARLSCYALATAWGLQPNGKTVKQGTCDLGQGVTLRAARSHLKNQSTTLH